MDDNDLISDEEELYRNVRGQLEKGEYCYDDEGQLRITSQAFLDRSLEPSVDRANLRNSDPSLSKLSPTNGITTLLSEDVRAVGNVITKGDKKNIKHAVDIIYKPIHEPPVNISHSQITVKPNFFGHKKTRDKAFKLLRISLAKLATKKGWVLKP